MPAFSLRLRRGEVWVARLNPNPNATVGKLDPAVIRDRPRC